MCLRQRRPDCRKSARVHNRERFLPGKIWERLRPCPHQDRATRILFALSRRQPPLWPLFGLTLELELRRRYEQDLHQEGPKLTTSAARRLASALQSPLFIGGIECSELKPGEVKYN